MVESSASPYVPALRKGLSLLELLAEHGHMTLAQVEHASGLNRTMAYRLLRVMDELGYVRHDPVRHQYGLGFRILGLGAVVAEQLHLAEIVWPSLVAIREETLETVTLGVLAGKHVVYLGMLHGMDGDEIAARFAGYHAPHATSAGKAILAFLSDDVRGIMMASLEPLPPLTPKTIVDTETLYQELARTRERGYAIEDEEDMVGTRSVGVPVLDTNGQAVAALGVVGPAERVDLASADRTAAQLWQVSRNMSRQLEHAS